MKTAGNTVTETDPFLRTSESVLAIVVGPRVIPYGVGDEGDRQPVAGVDRRRREPSACSSAVVRVVPGGHEHVEVHDRVIELIGTFGHVVEHGRADGRVDEVRGRNAVPVVRNFTELVDEGPRVGGSEHGIAEDSVDHVLLTIELQPERGIDGLGRASRAHDQRAGEHGARDHPPRFKEHRPHYRRTGSTSARYWTRLRNGVRRWTNLVVGL